MSTVSGSTWCLLIPMTGRVEQCRWWLCSRLVRPRSFNRVVTITVMGTLCIMGPWVLGWVNRRVATITIVVSFGRSPVF